MRIQNTVPEACPVWGKETVLAWAEPRPNHPKLELRTYCCADCGPVKTISVRLRPGSLPRAA
jgi:hypothetical protein